MLPEGWESSWGRTSWAAPTCTLSTSTASCLSRLFCLQVWKAVVVAHPGLLQPAVPVPTLQYLQRAAQAPSEVLDAGEACEGKVEEGGEEVLTRWHMGTSALPHTIRIGPHYDSGVPAPLHVPDS
eukprot:scaffold60809_cov23-Tisochrysis_lutea.AAC.1